MNLSSSKQGLLVVVWEWKNKQGRWRPYSPEVTQHLERAFGKKLKSVMLGDADPKLKDFSVNLSLLQQTCVTGNIGLATNVRRTLYPHTSPAGQGAVWEWAGDKLGDFHTYDMCVQCVLEESWSSGIQTIDMNSIFHQCPYVINFCNMTQTNKKTNASRNIRRKTQAAYPIGRPETPHQNGPSTSGLSSKCSVMHQENFNETSKGKRRGSKEEVESKPKLEGSARSLLNKVGDLLHFPGTGNSNEAVNGSKSCYNLDMPGTSRSSQANQNNHISNFMDYAQTGPPGRTKPSQADTRKPPVPKPRTLFPLNSEVMRVTRSSTLHQRMDSSDDQFGSNITLNSDYGSLSNRRPSIETISTYLSQDSYNEDYGADSKYMDHQSDMNGPTTTNLINLNDSMSDDDEEVFSADEEVREVLMNSDNGSKKAPCPKVPSHDPNSNQSASHFVPITSPDSSAASSLNGVKRKRAREKTVNNTSFSPPHVKNTNSISYPKRKATNENEKLLVMHTKPLNSPSKEDCSICMCSLNEESSYDQASSGFLVAPIVALSICNHAFHEECVGQLIASSAHNFIQCPYCKKIHGVKLGIQPRGNMTVKTMQRSLPGYSDCDTIVITYVIQSGIQGPEHPRPGRPYYPVGFPRVAYLPDNQKGRKVLRLLRVAWDRRLIFTVGTSVTNGREDAVTWNEIHHKTEFYDYSGHGYPDPEYLDNVLMELASHGVIE